MDHLKLHVERIVRPIAADPRRKDRMREELFEHLVSAHEDDRETAIARLGAPDSLRTELQRSVPRFERYLHHPKLKAMDRRFCPQPGESALRFAFTRSLPMVSLMFVTALIMTRVPVVLGVRPAPESGEVVRQLTIYGVLCGATFVSAWLFAATGAMQALSRKSALAPQAKAGIAFGFSALYISSFFAPLALFSGAGLGEVFGFLREVPPGLVIVVAALPLLFVRAKDAYACNRRRYLEWGHLTLE